MHVKCATLPVCPLLAERWANRRHPATAAIAGASVGCRSGTTSPEVLTLKIQLVKHNPSGPVVEEASKVQPDAMFIYIHPRVPGSSSRQERGNRVREALPSPSSGCGSRPAPTASWAMARFPSDIHEAELSTGPFAWLEAGETGGLTVLCLHGFPDHPRTFEPLLPALVGAGYRVVAPWMRGYAPSGLGGPYDLRQLGDDVIALARYVSPDSPVILLGHDWGALASWYAAAAAPQRIAALVTISVPHPAAFARNIRRHPLQLLRGWYVGLFQLPMVPEALLPLGDFAAIARVYERENGERPWYWDDLRDTLGASLPAPIEYYRALRKAPPLPGEIRVPTLFLTGKRDPAVKPLMAEGQEDLIRASYRIGVLDTGHFVHHQAPEEASRRILDFLSTEVSHG